MSQILIVDDEPSICWALEQALTEEGHRVQSVATAEEGLEFAKTVTPDLVIMDIRLPGMDGITALQELRQHIGESPVIIITAFGNLETAVQALSRGAFEYLTKPFDLDAALQVIRRALDARQLKLSSTTPSLYATHEVQSSPLLLGSSPAMQAVFREIAIVADRDVPVLITGESGSGKELVAEAIHRYSKRKNGPFIPICIPAMSESVLESELFGHTRGAFTGAIEKRSGLLKAADRGTAFLDEIGDVSIPTQVKLLRVLESRLITPVGGESAEQSDFRLVAATNRNLEEMVAHETFRKDLFFRLNVFQIRIPSLRERPADIPLLAQHFMRAIDRQGKVTLSDGALNELLSRPWPGNVRELRNTIEHAVIMTRQGEISAEVLPESSSLKESVTPEHRRLSEVVRDWVQGELQSSKDSPDSMNLYEAFLTQTESVLFKEALRHAQGNRQTAARLLGIHRQTLREKMKRYETSDDEQS